MSPSITILAQHLLNGVLIGCAYALIAMGLTMIFGVMNIANFAHGEFYMLGGFVAFYLVSLIGLNYFAALPLAVVVVVALALVLQHAIFRRLREAPMMTTTLVTIGLSIFLENFALLLWGPQPQSIPTPFATKPLSFLGARRSRTRRPRHSSAFASTASTPTPSRSVRRSPRPPVRFSAASFRSSPPPVAS